MTVVLLCLGAVCLNIPFGYYRAGVRRLSWQWFLAIHLPVPLLFVMRVESGENWKIIPLLVLFDVVGQLAGGRLRPAPSAGRAPGKVTAESEDL